MAGGIGANTGRRTISVKIGKWQNSVEDVFGTSGISLWRRLLRRNPFIVQNIE
jgi:hypothetical protein